MESETTRMLAKAQAHFYAWELVEAYHILRRFFGRLPFKPEPEHATFVAMFARVLAELGKCRELQFYKMELERLYRVNQDPLIGYQLAVVYLYLPTPDVVAARKILEGLNRDTIAPDLRAKATMFLAWTYDQFESNIERCRELIDSIPLPSDRDLALLIHIWKARILRCEGNLSESAEKLLDLLKGLEVPRDWYPYFCAQTELALTYLDMNLNERATELLTQIRRDFGGRNFKSVENHLTEIEKKISESQRYSEVKVIKRAKKISVRYENKVLRLDGELPNEKLLMLLLKKKVLAKADAIKHLYHRPYDSEFDDEVIRREMEKVRKRLQKLGIPTTAVVFDKKGYRFLPPVSMMKETHS